MSDSPNFPSPSSSVAETVLPTPDQPYSSRRSSMASPTFSDMSPTPLGVSEDTPKRRPSDTVPDQEHDFPTALFGTNARPKFSSMSSNRSQRRSATNPNPVRAAPPPILLRRPTDLHSGKSEEVPLSAGSSASSKRSPVMGGLNIAGLPGMPGTEMDEAGDSLPDLIKSPARNFFAASSPSGAPASPAWPSFERNSPRINGSPQPRHKARASLDVPFSPLGQQRAESRFDPTPQHGIHARNLSLYFPQPGAPVQNVPEGDLIASPEPLHDVMISGGKERKVFGGTGDWTFGANVPASLEPPGSEGGKRGKRRGHHVCSPKAIILTSSTSIHYHTTSSLSSIQRRLIPRWRVRMARRTRPDQIGPTRRKKSLCCLPRRRSPPLPRLCRLYPHPNIRRSTKCYYRSEYCNSSSDPGCGWRVKCRDGGVWPAWDTWWCSTRWAWGSAC